MVMTSRDGMRCYGAVCLAILFLAAWGISLSRNLCDPIGYDQALYVYMTERVMAGQQLYTELWEQNTPGIIGVHWLMLKVIGRSPVDLRLFDALWQAATLMALVILIWRIDRRWVTAWLAGLLYVLAYYGTGYVHTAQREAFTVLPMLLMMHAVLPGGCRSVMGRCVLHVLAGIAGFAIFAIKPPLGLCFGMIWLYLLGRTVRRQDNDGKLLIAFTAGFLISLALSVIWLIHAGIWPEMIRVLTRRDVPQYIAGPSLIRSILPQVAVAAGILWVLLWSVMRKSDAATGNSPQCLISQTVVGTVVFVLLLATYRWKEWQPVAIRMAGLWIPLLGVVLLTPWSRRSPGNRLLMWMLLATVIAVVLQGRFFLYHLYPVLACASGLLACELARWLKTQGMGTWVCVSLGALIYFVGVHWGATMTAVSWQPNVLSTRSLAEHYTAITRNKPRYPTYATTMHVAERVRALTGSDDPIACTIIEPRLYYFTQRPPASRLLVPQDIFYPLFGEFIQAIHDRQPKVVLARIPADTVGETNSARVQSAVFRELVSHYGPAAGILESQYRLSEWDHEIAILVPRS